MEEPHESLFLVLPCLYLSQLLAISQVSRSLRDAVLNDVLPWLDFVVEPPLSRKLTDDILFKYASKACGRLRTLSLLDCTRVTDDGLLRVVRDNHHIEKLYVAGCTNLTPEGIISAVKTLRFSSDRLRYLKINGIYNLNKEYLQELLFYINPNQGGQHEPAQIFYHTGARECSSESIDVEICPKCDEVRIVYSCPKETCSECRGCVFCIPRCAECGVCINASEETEDTICGDSICSTCWLRLKPKCSFCNKPYCRKHQKQEARSSLRPDQEFVCDICHWQYIESTSNL